MRRPGEVIPCGAAAVVWFARLNGAWPADSVLRSLCRRYEKIPKPSLYQLARDCERLGVRARGVKVTLRALARLQCPAVAHERRNGSGHFVVVEWIGDGWVRVIDVAEPRLESVAAFESKFTGYALIPASRPRGTDGGVLRLDRRVATCQRGRGDGKSSVLYRCTNDGRGLLRIRLWDRPRFGADIRGPHLLKPGDATVIRLPCKAAGGRAATRGQQHLALRTNDPAHPVVFLTALQ